jgi:hypothetical protein
MPVSNNLYNKVLSHLSDNPKLCQLVSFLIQSVESDDIPIIYDKLIGDWDTLLSGQRVTVTWADPFCVDEGYIFMLPGLIPEEPLKGVIIHIPQSAKEENEQQWFVLKHLLVFAETIEIQPSY